MSDEQRDPKGWIQTFSGGQFWPVDPRASEADIESIAHALSQQVRFAGHTREPYNIAQHSVLVSLRAEELAQGYGNPCRGNAAYAEMVAAWGLLHDASEAYCVDIPRPLKKYLTGYEEIEARVQAVICTRFALPFSMPPEVHQADNDVLAAEARDLYPKAKRPADWRLTNEPAPCRIRRWDAAPAWLRAVPLLGRWLGPWSPRYAEARFLKRWTEIGRNVP